MKLLRNIGELLTLEAAARKQGRGIREEDLSRISKAAVLIKGDQIVWSGPQNKIPKEFSKKKIKEINLNGKVVMPGLVECHTHLVFAGNRADEFELRQRGVSYQEIAARGGGIISTMKKTRAASLAELQKSGRERIGNFQSQGVTTVEAKSGYGLDLKSELKQLKALDGIKQTRIVKTFLGAHAKPPEYKGYDEYLQYLADNVLPMVARRKLASRVDAFIEAGFFPVEATRSYFQKAQKLGLDVVIHAEQLSLTGGTELGIELGALSCDHVIELNDSLISKLAKSEVTSVLLPAADMYMRCKYPPARKLIDAGARVALATDFNPGSSPTQNVQLVGLLARLEMKMTLPEVIAAYTVGAAHALKLQNQIGSIAPGKKADLLVWNGDWSELFYEASSAKVDMVFFEGLPVYNARQ